MRKLTQKLVLSVVTMALVVIALGTSTFAWFTLQNAASVGTFQAQVTSGQGIEVSLGTGSAQTMDFDDTDAPWYTAIPIAVIQNFIDTKYSGFRFDNVTSTDGISMKQENGTADAPVGSYIQFQLYFRSREAAMPIALSSAVLGGQVGDWTVNSPAFRHTDGLLYGTLPVGSTDTSYSTMKVAAYTAARLSVKSTGTENAFVYQRPAETGNQTTISNSTALPTVSYDIVESAPSSGSFIVGPAARGAASYERANAIVRGPWASATALNGLIPDAKTVVEPDTTVLTLSALRTGGDLDGYAVGTLTVRVWIEGWDADAYDAIFNQVLTVAIGFAKAV